MFISKRIFLILLSITIFLCSCSKSFEDNETIKATESIKAAKSDLSTSSNVNLPANFTVEKIKNALLEYVNYRLWLYPALKNHTSDKNFDSYIDKTINVEIRLYSNNPERLVYCYTSIGNWLLVFTNIDDVVYCEGQVDKGEKYWPQDNNYQVIEKYSVVIPKPHKPNYGTSAKKTKMIDILEAKVKSDCESFYKDSEGKYDTTWKNTDVYIADFYEYEMGTHAWLCKQDGTLISYPVIFVEENNEIKVQTTKIDEYKNKNILDELGQHLLERDISDAVRHFKCNIN